MSTMKSKLKFLVMLAAICLISLSSAGGRSKVPPELMGTWNYTSMSPLKNGKPFGTVHFDLGQWMVTFNEDATWSSKMSFVNPHGLNGTYEVHGHDVDMKLANGKPYNKYRFTIEDDGKALVLTGKEHIIRATRE